MIDRGRPRIVSMSSVQTGLVYHIQIQIIGIVLLQDLCLVAIDRHFFSLF